MTASTAAQATNDQMNGRTSKTGRKRENGEFASFAGRIIRAYGRRIAAGDVEALPELAKLQRDMDVVMGQAVVGLKQAGYSWADVAERLGTSRQAAHQRFGHLVKATD